ncbi:Uncharacterised protein [[Flavobacterium] thermophilum]|nr:Uncharacterised protein [[Flavobacterium] thermophilum]
MNHMHGQMHGHRHLAWHETLRQGGADDWITNT